MAKTEDIDQLWSLVNVGYAIVFSYFNDSGSGHIEVGYPDEGTLKYLTIGAGSKVGKKSWTETTDDITIQRSFANTDIQIATKAFLYVGYIK